MTSAGLPSPGHQWTSPPGAGRQPEADLAKVAVMDLFVVITTLNGFCAPSASPDQPAKTQPAFGTAFKVMIEPNAYEGWSGVLATPPPPLMVSVNVGTGVKLAVILLFAVIATDAGLLMPVRSPDQPVNQKPASGTAVSVTAVLF